MGDNDEKMTREEVKQYVENLGVIRPREEAEAIAAEEG